MLAPVTFVLADGRQVSPLHVAPWADEPEAAGLPGILGGCAASGPAFPSAIRCRPRAGRPTGRASWGRRKPTRRCTATASNHEWRGCPTTAASLAAGARLSGVRARSPASSARSRPIRTHRPSTRASRIAVRRPCRLPIGLHPVFRLPPQPGAARAGGRASTMAAPIRAPSSLARRCLRADRRFAALAAVPARAGGSVDAGAVPFAADVEELLQLKGLDGRRRSPTMRRAIACGSPGRRSISRACFSGIRTAAARQPPWNGRHLALGIEPICSPFGLGPETARGRQPDRPLRRADGARLCAAIAVHHPLPHRGGAAVTADAALPRQAEPAASSPILPGSRRWSATATASASAAIISRGCRSRCCGPSPSAASPDSRYVSWAGGLPLEILLEADAVAEIDICFSSLDIFGLPPRFRAAAEAAPCRSATGRRWR